MVRFKSFDLLVTLLPRVDEGDPEPTPPDGGSDCDCTNKISYPKTGCKCVVVFEETRIEIDQLKAILRKSLTGSREAILKSTSQCDGLELRVEKLFKKCKSEIRKTNTKKKLK